MNNGQVQACWLEQVMARFNHTSINELAKVDGLEQVEGLEQTMARFNHTSINELAKVEGLEQAVARLKPTAINEVAKVEGLEQAISVWAADIAAVTLMEVVDGSLCCLWDVHWWR